MAYLRQFFAEIWLNLNFYRIYWPDFLAGLFADMAFFYAIWMALGSVVVSNPSADLGGGQNILFMYAVFGIVVGIFQSVAFTVAQEAQRGTLEHLALARGGLVVQLLFRGASDSLFILFRTGVLLGVLLVLTGASFNPKPFWLLALALLVVSALGFSLSMAALALYFKKILSFFTIIQFSLLLYFFSVNHWRDYMVYLPLAPAAHLLSRSFSGGGEWTEWVVLSAFLQALLFVCFGLLALGYTHRLVRLRGILGRY
ncbi:hypothetical protein Ththe16_1986 (plasmid) [Thermus thermophilus SG0.5JP17-16]|uniref:ABC-2 type transporter domain-containing protein n=1 Tax=Thermus thermophilus (strain SG0.5JP17-16) TaxID=762633 RepID=F6DIX8_THETG|nr:hypothetical protein [Thermus thermophilus]AEG34375.1 hypothetical protein Ththe16_1986 [Thermus thermophilus SG0.5JP17-16]